MLTKAAAAIESCLFATISVQNLLLQIRNFDDRELYANLVRIVTPRKYSVD
ncbi:MAG: hypothetical protein LBB21_01115 [Holosporaceae bacterium]|jgi:hypothetical protein|nr:hypothetical protein [Holosporaceae bacterium]